MALILGIAAVAIVGGLLYWLWFMSIRVSAERRRVSSPSSQSYDIFVNREGVAIYGRSTAILRLDASMTVASALLRHRRGDPWRWAVTVRDSGVWRDTPLVHEVFQDRPAAQGRAEELARSVAAGTFP